MCAVLWPLASSGIAESIAEIMDIHDGPARQGMHRSIGANDASGQNLIRNQTTLPGYIDGPSASTSTPHLQPPPPPHTSTTTTCCECGSCYRHTQRHVPRSPPQPPRTHRLPTPRQHPGPRPRAATIDSHTTQETAWLRCEGSMTSRCRISSTSRTGRGRESSTSESPSPVSASPSPSAAGARWKRGGQISRGIY